MRQTRRFGATPGTPAKQPAPRFSARRPPLDGWRIATHPRDPATISEEFAGEPVALGRD